MRPRTRPMSKLRTEIERLFRQADRLARANDRQGAIGCYRELLDLEGLVEEAPLVAECAHWGLAELAIEAGDTELAESHLKQAMALNPEEPGYHTELGLIYNSRADYLAAAEQFEASLKLRPDHPQTVHLLGWALFMGGERARGRALLERACQLDDCDITILNDLAVCLTEEGQWDKALALVERACAVDPGNRLLESFRELIVHHRKPARGSRS